MEGLLYLQQSHPQQEEGIYVNVKLAAIPHVPSPTMYSLSHTHTHTHTQAIKDWMLALAVGVLVLIDITILLVYTVIEGYRGNLIAIRVQNRENMKDVDGVSV